MPRVITIDPGKRKCGLVLAEISEKKVYKAIILKSELLAMVLQVVKLEKNYIFLKKKLQLLRKKIPLTGLKQDISNFFQLVA